jgi:phospholipase B1, membrane-associated
MQLSLALPVSKSNLVGNLKHEIGYLTRMMEENPDIDMANDFKLLNLFIGSNDLCASCIPFAGMLSPDAFERHIVEILAELESKIPCLVVNIMMQFNVSQIWDLTKDDEYCQTLQNSGTVFECTCAFLPGPLGEATRRIMDELVVQYNLRLLKIWLEYQTHRNDNFAIIIDPLLKDVSVRDWNVDALSKVDCFHPALKTHKLLAIGAWNNLFRPAYLKKGLSKREYMKCPYSWDRIWTV